MDASKLIGTGSQLPDEELDYQIVWNFSDPTEVILSSTWTIKGKLLLGDTAEHSPSFDNTTTTVWVYAVPPKSRSLVVNTITTTRGRTHEREIQILGS